MNRALLSLLFLLSSTLSVKAQNNTQNGATVGGVAGAVIGGIIGHQNDETPEGALIGGAVGAIAGGLLGRSQDNQLERQRYLQQQAYYQQQQQAYLQSQQAASSGINMNDLVNMVRSGLSEPLIISQMQSKGVSRRLEVSEIIALHQQGVGDNLISAMQNAPLSTQLARPQLASPPVTAAPTIVRQPSVIVQEPVIYAAPSPVYVERYYPGFPPYHHHHRHSGTYLRIGF
ncbi:MAG: glycine zipper 2TM domain-containing protein [Planctomycetales bacterium]|nr:glycine zipper 2TM domain-containing protein [Planctomycetales bacterium]